MGLGQYNSLGEYCGPHTASSVFLILVSRDHTFDFKKNQCLKRNKDKVNDFNTIRVIVKSTDNHTFKYVISTPGAA